MKPNTARFSLSLSKLMPLRYFHICKLQVHYSQKYRTNRLPQSSKDTAREDFLHRRRPKSSKEEYGHHKTCNKERLGTFFASHLCSNKKEGRTDHEANEETMGYI